MPTHLQAHFIFFKRSMLTLKKIKRACKPTHATVQGFVRTSTDRALNVECLEQPLYEPQTVALRPNSRAAHNIKIKRNFKNEGINRNSNSCVSNEHLYKYEQ